MVPDTQSTKLVTSRLDLCPSLDPPLFDDCFCCFFRMEKGWLFCSLLLLGTTALFQFSLVVSFFKLQSPLLGLIDIVLLWVSLGITTILFFRHSVLAGLLFVPYWIWLSYAVALNFMLWKLN